MTRLDEIKKKMLELEEETPNWKDTTVYVAGFLDGAMWADQHPHWISVEDELPEDDSEVACLTADGEIYIDRYVRGTMYGNIWRKTERKPVKWLPLKAKKGGEE